jgi:S1-C subfamily serine protease
MRVAAAVLTAIIWSAGAGGSACRDRTGERVAFAHLGLSLAHPAVLESPAPVIGGPSAALLSALALTVAGAGPGAPAQPAQPPQPGDRAAAPRPVPASPAARARLSEAMLVPYHVELRASRPRGLRLEIHIDHRPQQPRTALALARGVRHGASLAIAEVASERIEGRSWRRTRFSYRGEDGSQAGIEYAALAGPYLYRVTAYGPADAAAALAGHVAPTLRLRGAPDSALEDPPATGVVPAAVQRAAGAVVAVVAADLDHAAPDGPVTLAPAAMGSGVVVDAEGRVLTSLHTLHDEGRDALHDLFLVGREHAALGLVFVCAGRAHAPGHANINRALDLALIRCELDMSGEALAPSGWLALAPVAAAPPAAGTRLWVLGYAEADDGVLRARAGGAMGPSQPGAGPEQGFAVDVAITPGMSGGAVVDERGALVGVVQGFRERFQASSAGIRGVGRTGLVRPAQQARLLIEGR